MMLSTDERTLSTLYVDLAAPVRSPCDDRRDYTESHRLSDYWGMSRDRSAIRTPLFRLDPGWLFVVAGATIVVAMVLVPATDQLARTAHQRDKARALADHAARRLASHAEYLDAVERREPTLIRSLAASQLNLIPDTHQVLRTNNAPADPRPVLDQLEPGFEPPEPPARPDTTLRAIASDPTNRLWAMAVGMVSILYGLLPPARNSPDA